jgi:hypothetical protein
MNLFIFKKIKYILILLIILITAGEATATEIKRLAVRFVYAQGFLACNRRYDDPIAKFTTTIEAAKQRNENLVVDYATYYHCFDAGIFEHPMDEVEHMYRTYVNTDGTRRTTSEISAYTAPYQLIQDLETEAATLEQQGYTMPLQVYFVGHSHGGWFAMRTTAHLANNPRIQVKQLYTVDPISYTLCPSSFFVQNVVRNSIPTWYTTSPDDCHRAPRDLVAFEPTIRSTVGGNWTNFYQTTMPYLRSGPIQGASWNIDIPWLSTFDYWNGHRSLLSDPRTLNGFFNSLARNLDDFATTVE